MSGIIDDPDVRHLQRLRLVLSMRGFFSSLFRWLTAAAFGSRRFYFRPEQAEFPAAHQSACNILQEPFRGRRAAGCASIDALRSYDNSVNIEDPHEIAFIRETFAPFAWRLPPKGRSPRAASVTSAGPNPEKDILAETGGAFWQRQRPKETRHCFPEWRAATAASAQT